MGLSRRSPKKALNLHSLFLEGLSPILNPFTLGSFAFKIGDDLKKCPYLGQKATKNADRQYLFDIVEVCRVNSGQHDKATLRLGLRTP